MPHPYDVKKSGSADSDGDLVLTSEDVSAATEHLIRVTDGAVLVEVSIDNGVTWTDSASFPVAVMKLNSSNPSSWALGIAVGELAVLVGCFDRVRLRADGGASAAHMSSYRRFL